MQPLFGPSRKTRERHKELDEKRDKATKRGAAAIEKMLRHVEVLKNGNGSIPHTEEDGENAEAT